MSDVRISHLQFAPAGDLVCVSFAEFNPAATRDVRCSWIEFNPAATRDVRCSWLEFDPAFAEAVSSLRYIILARRIGRR